MIKILQLYKTIFISTLALYIYLGKAVEHDAVGDLEVLNGVFKIDIFAAEDEPLCCHFLPCDLLDFHP